MLQKHALLRFSKKTGKIDTTMTGLGTGMMKLWALQNTTSSKMCFIVNLETGLIVYQTTGTKDGFPDVKENNLGHIDDVCEGLWEVLVA